MVILGLPLSFQQMNVENLLSDYTRLCSEREEVS